MSLSIKARNSKNQNNSNKHARNLLYYSTWKEMIFIRNLDDVCIISLSITKDEEVQVCMKNRKIKLIVLLAAVLLFLFTSLNVATSYLKMKETVEESIANQSLEAAISLAKTIDKETYQKFLNDPQKNEYYIEIRNYLTDARKKLGALHVYTLMIDNPKVSHTMIVGLPKENTDNFIIGEVCTVPEEQVKRAYEGKAYVTEVIEDPFYGAYVSVGAPIKDDLGKVIGFLGIDISADSLNEIIETVLKNNLFIFIYNGVFILLVIGSFILLQRWYQKEVTKEVGDTEDTYQAEIRALITSVSSLRHDFTNHIQVLHGLLQLGEADQAQKYLKSLSKEVQDIESLKLSTDHPGLSILLQTKKLAAQSCNINMIFTTSDGSFDNIKTTDLIKILSNLIDNAIEASLELPENERKITICCTVEEKHHLFKVTNTGPKIKKNNLIFKKGYSTKKAEHGKIRGQGLFIVKEIVQKYNGDISLHSNDSETIAIVKIPFKKN